MEESGEGGAAQGGHAAHGGGSLLKRMREATGTVYGDIGTSVLYTIMEITRETIRLKHHHEPTDLVDAMIEKGGPGLVNPDEAIGGLSLVYWALIFLTVKYDLFIMRADNRGEGGSFSLLGLLRGVTGKVVGLSVVSYLVVAASGLLAADGMITPPISLLGAYEPLGESAAVALTIVSLFALFKPQWRGTSKIGGFFGWFMVLVWFPWIALKGFPWLVRNPEVFLAFNPIYALSFLASFPSLGAFIIIGVVVLAITGGEAKYADIGHFARKSQAPVPDGQSMDPRDSGRRPVMFSWLSLVLPCLMLNYAGQVGYLLERGVPARANTFYALTPRTGIEGVDGVILGIDMAISAVAAFIAAQALITGMFSIVKQAIALGFCPRFAVEYKSREAEGQVYIPAVNWSMFVGCVVITLLFRTASNLAAAYGIAVTGTMVITTIAFGFVTRYRWGWPAWKVALVVVPFFLVDALFFGSTLLKLTHGGYVPVAIATAFVVVMLTWQWGRSRFGAAFYAFGVKEGKKISWLVALRDMLDEIQVSIDENLPLAKALVQGRRRLVESDRAFVFLCSRPIRTLDDYVPVALRVFLKKYGVLPAHVTFFHVNQVPIAESGLADRYEVTDLGQDIVAVSATYGYMEQPDIRGALRELQRRKRIDIPSERWIIEIGEEEILLRGNLPLLTMLRISIFRIALRMSTPAHKFFGLGYDAAVSKEIIPVVFDRDGARISLPELEVTETAPPVRAAK